jgi:hypothetical protein
MAEPIGRRRLADTKEGRLTIIVVVGGTLLVALSFLDVWLANTADDEADQVRVALRRELAGVDDATLEAFPDSGEQIAQAAARALADDGLGARVARVERPDRDEVVVAVETGMAWHPRCVEAELRGGGTVLTHRQARPC